MSNYDKSIKAIQESSSRAMEPFSKSLSLYSHVLASIKSFEASFDKMIGPYQYLSEQFAQSPSFQSIESLQKTYNKLINSTNVSLNTTLLVDSFSKALRYMPQPVFTPQFIDALEKLGKYSFPGELDRLYDDSNTTDSDYVVTEKNAVKEIVLSDTVTFPVGQYRVKIKTGDFIALIFGIITMLINMMSYIGQPDPYASTEMQNQIEQNQVQLLETQNQILYDLLHTMDASSSNQAEVLESLRDSVEAQNSAISDLKESLDSIERSIDNMNKDDCTEPEN